jgi:23S rRNA pseudouridine2605 synthase
MAYMAYFGFAAPRFLCLTFAFSFLPPAIDSRASTLDNTLMRLQQYLARSGVTSRRKAEDLIRAGRVSINNKMAQLGAVVGDKDVVRLDGERVRLPNKSVVIALHKPKGFTTTHEDEHAEKLVYQLVPEHPGLHSVGRLDKDTEGLLLLTNDGNLTQRLTHPSNEVPKLYRVWSKRGRLSVAECQTLVQGVMLGDGFAKAMEAIPTKEGAKLVLTEGRKREVRRMLGKIGHPVEKLVRLAVGVIELGVLQTGEYRYLEPEEVKLLMDNVAPPKLRKPTPAAKQRRAIKSEETPERTPRSMGKPSAASGSKLGGKPPQQPARSSKPQATLTLSEANKARIAKTLQRLRAEDEAEIPQAASHRAGRSGKSGAVRATKPESPKPTRANPEPSRKPRPENPKSKPRSPKPPMEARASGRADSKPRRAEGNTRATQRSETQPVRSPKTEKAPRFAKEARGSAKPKPEGPARGSIPKPSKPSKPISQKAKPTVKSGDERVRGGQGQGANQRSANKGANRRTGPKNTR